MKNGRLSLGSIYDSKPLTVAKAFYQPILELIQRFYAESPRSLFIPDDIEASPYTIVGPYVIETEEWGNRPTIVVTRGAITAGLRPGFRAQAGADVTTGSRTYHDQASGSCMIHIVDVERTEEIAEEIFDLIWLSKNEVMELGVFKIEGPVLSPMTKLNGGANEHLKICQISFNMTMNRKWEVTPIDKPILAGVNYNEL